MSKTKKPPKIKWLVEPVPSGFGFMARGWPTAYYCNGKEDTCANIQCAKDYSKKDVEAGTHPPLRLRIADHAVSPWRWVVQKEEYATYALAKAAVLVFLAQNETFLPKGVA